MKSRREVMGAAIAAMVLGGAASAEAGESVALDLSVYDKIPPVKYPFGWLRW